MMPGHKVEFKTLNCIDNSIILEQLKENLKKDQKEFKPARAHKRKALIVGGGPSLKTRIGEIKKHKRNGGRIFCANGAHDYLLSKNIVPDYVVTLDPQESVAEFFKKPDPRVTYLVASTAHPKVFEALEGYNIERWHPDLAAGEREILIEHYKDKHENENGEDHFVHVPGGSTATMRAIVLGYLKGFRNFILYGIDASFHGDQQHAYEQANYTDEQMLTVRVQDTVYVSSKQMAAQVQEFLRFWDNNHKFMKIKVSGSGLLPHVFRLHKLSVQRKNQAKSA